MFLSRLSERVSVRMLIQLWLAGSVEMMQLLRMDKLSVQARFRRRGFGELSRVQPPSGLAEGLSVELDDRCRVEVDAGPRLRPISLHFDSRSWAPWRREYAEV